MHASKVGVRREGNYHGKHKSYSLLGPCGHVLSTCELGGIEWGWDHTFQTIQHKWPDVMAQRIHCTCHQGRCHQGWYALAGSLHPEFLLGTPGPVSLFHSPSREPQVHKLALRDLYVFLTWNYCLATDFNQGHILCNCQAHTYGEHKALKYNFSSDHSTKHICSSRGVERLSVVYVLHGFTSLINDSDLVESKRVC